VAYPNLNLNACVERRLNTTKIAAFSVQILTEDIRHTKQERYALYHDVSRTIINPRVILEVYYISFAFYLFYEAIRISYRISNGRMTGN
jgi:hypothetical protein